MRDVYCPKCGRRAFDGERFCARCGTRLTRPGIGERRKKEQNAATGIFADEAPRPGARRELYKDDVFAVQKRKPKERRERNPLEGDVFAVRERKPQARRERDPFEDDVFVARTRKNKPRREEGFKGEASAARERRPKMRREKEPFEDDIFSVRERKPKLIKERESFESGVFLDEERRAKRRSQGKAHDEIKRKPEKQPTRERKTSDEPLRPKKDISSGKPKKISPQTVDKDTFSGKTEKSREKPDRKTEDKLPRHVDAANPVKKKAHPSNEPVNQSGSSQKREKRPAAQDKRREGSPKRSSGIRKWLRRRSRHIRRVYHRVRRRIDFRLVLLSRKARIVWRRWRLTAGDLWTRASDGLGRLKRACESRLRALTASGAKKRRPTKLRNSRVERERETDVFSVGAPKKINSAEKGHSRTAKNAPRVKTGDLRSETPKALSADGSKKGKGDSRRSDVPQRENRNRKSSSKTRPKSHKRPPNVSCPRGKQPIKRPPRRRPTERESFVEKHLRSMIAMLLLAVTVMIMMVWSVSSVSGQRLFAQLGLGGASGYIILGDECMDSGNYGRAVEHYYKALTRRTEYESAIKLARAYRRTGDIEREVSALLLCIDQFEDNREPYERLKEIYPFPSTRPTAVKDALFKGVTIFSDITLAY